MPKVRVTRGSEGERRETADAWELGQGRMRRRICLDTGEEAGRRANSVLSVLWLGQMAVLSV